ncbi:hypothetical protein B0H13DRAFT_2486375 [Mycena leptocephala]|nr:hypothetical protein B0H13DRAFT_2486375 [Mycena leptocephala]
MSQDYTEDQLGIINDKLHEELASLFETMDTSPTASSKQDGYKLDKILSWIAPCIRKDTTYLKKICISKRIIYGDFIGKLKAAHGGKDYRYVHDLFSGSINTIHEIEAAGIIASFLSDIRPALETFLQSEKEPLGMWEPDSTLDHAGFLKGLKIPATSKNEPDMLLHELGRFLNESPLRERLMKIFHPRSVAGIVTLLNTSGSGKTRMVLEGLCLMWGFYFTCHVDEPGHGSVDLTEALQTHIPSDPCFTHELPQTDFIQPHKTNCEIAEGRLGEVLLARLCIFELFCEVATELFGPNLKDEHRKRWVILQIRPMCIGTRHYDIFSALTIEIKGIEQSCREQLIRSKISNLRELLRATDAPIFCVVDECQVAATSLTNAFMTTDPEKRALRSAIREVAKVFAVEGQPITVNFTGTGVRKDIILDILKASPVFKGRNIKPVTHFGAFNTLDEQTAYMKRFMPPDLATNDTFQELFKRVSHWLRGRYRFTAAYMKELLITGFQRPHLMLNAFIRASTRFPIPRTVDQQMSAGFQLTDSREYWAREEGEAIVSDLERFQFEKLKDDSTLEQVIREYTCEFWMRSSITSIMASARHFDLIQCGFARYAENDVGSEDNPKIVIDEPLVLLALSEWLHVRDLPLAEMLRSQAAKAVTRANGANGLEEYLALYFSAVFDDKTPLTEVFRFHKYIDPPEWAKHPASLVSFYRIPPNTEKSDPTNWELREGHVEHHSRPSVSIGKATSSMEETLQWLNHEDRAPICFPDRNMGPDLLFVLKLGDGKESKIWVAIQSKFGSGDSLSSSTIRAAVPTVTPDQFYGLRKETRPDGKVVKVDPAKQKKNKHQVLKLMDALPNRLLTLGPEKYVGFNPDPRLKIIRKLAAEAKQKRNAEAKARKNVEKIRGAKKIERGAKQAIREDLPYDEDLPDSDDENLRDVDMSMADAMDKVFTPEDRAMQEAILQGAGLHSVLRVVVGWPAATHLHTRATALIKNTLNHYFDEENHPIAELNIKHWGKTMRKLHQKSGSFVDQRGKGKNKRLAEEEHNDAPAAKFYILGTDSPPWPSH